MSSENLMKIDRAIIEKVRKCFRITAKDMKEVIFLPHEEFGMNIKSFQVTDLEATMRELECGLNGNENHCESMRAIMQVWADRIKGKKSNNWLNFEKDSLIESNARKIAAHGIFLRDRRYHLCNVLIDIIYNKLRQEDPQSARKRVNGPLGSIDYKQDTTGVLGKGDRSLLKFSTHSNDFTKLRRFMEKQQEMDNEVDWRWSTMWKTRTGRSRKFFGLNEFELAECAHEATMQIRNDTTNFYGFYEWRGEKEVGVRIESNHNILDWTSQLRKWYTSNASMTKYKVNYNVREFEEEIYSVMVDEQRIGEEHNGKRYEGEVIETILEGSEIDEEQEMDSIMSWNDEGSEMSISDDKSIEFLDLDKRIPTPETTPGSQAMSKDEAILAYFESKNCPFFTGSDGGNLTWEVMARREAHQQPSYVHHIWNTMKSRRHRG